MHRRLLYAMRLLKLDPGSGFKKCARVVGDVIGKYHPHGDQAVYDALVRLAQDFAQRYPLVDGQGNFGNVDGDNAAAMRYTEARLTDTAKRLLDGLDENAVDFRETYDGEDKEPIVLPGGFPNPSRQWLLGDRRRYGDFDSAAQTPMNYAKPRSISSRTRTAHRKSYFSSSRDRTSRPAACWSPTKAPFAKPIPPAVAASASAPAGTERTWNAANGRSSSPKFPIRVQKSRLIEKIAELLIAKKLPLLDDIRDESAEDVRIVLVPRSRNVDPTILMESLFKLTDLENRFALNMNVLSHGKVPMVMGLKQALQEWLDHRKEVLVRRSEHRLAPDQSSSGSARRLFDRLSEPRRGHPHYPRGR